MTSHFERIKWCLNEQTNVYAFKLAMLRDITESRLDEKIESILVRYKWPYTPVDYSKDRHHTHIKKISTMLRRKIGNFGSHEDSKVLFNMDLQSAIGLKTPSKDNE